MVSQFWSMPANLIEGMMIVSTDIIVYNTQASLTKIAGSLGISVVRP